MRSESLATILFVLLLLPPTAVRAQTAAGTLEGTVGITLVSAASVGVAPLSVSASSTVEPRPAPTAAQPDQSATPVQITRQTGTIAETGEAAEQLIAMY